MTLSDTSTIASCEEIAVLNTAKNITLVQDPATRRIYVKKVLHFPGADAGRVYRYLQTHYIRGLPLVTDVRERDGELVILEEYITGQTLRSVLDNGNRFSVEEAVGILNQVCGILDAFQSAGLPVRFCNNSSDNIVLTFDGSIRLMHLQTSGKPSSRQLVGTEDPGQYFETGKAGRQAIAEDSGLQAAIRSVGILLCELLTGRPPFDGQPADRSSLPERTHGSLTVSSLPRRGSSSPAVTGLPGGRPGRVIRKCLQKDPKKCYRNLRSLRQDLEKCLDRPMADRSPTSEDRFERFPDESMEVLISRNDKQTDAKPWLLPGFRSGNPIHYLAAACAYGLLLYFTSDFHMDDFPPGFPTWTARIVFLLWGLMILLFTGNYMDIWDILRITRIRSPLLRLLAVLAIDAVLVVGWAFAIVLTGLALGVYHSRYFG